MSLSRQQGRSETEEYSSDSESESEDEEELQMILEDLQKQNEELEVRIVRLFYLKVRLQKDWFQSTCLIMSFERRHEKYSIFFICYYNLTRSCLFLKLRLCLYRLLEQKHPPESGHP